MSNTHKDVDCFLKSEEQDSYENRNNWSNRQWCHWTVLTRCPSRWELLRRYSRDEKKAHHKALVKYHDIISDWMAKIGDIETNHILLMLDDALIGNTEENFASMLEELRVMIHALDQVIARRRPKFPMLENDDFECSEYCWCQERRPCTKEPWGIVVEESEDALSVSSIDQPDFEYDLSFENFSFDYDLSPEYMGDESSDCMIEDNTHGGRGGEECEIIERNHVNEKEITHQTKDQSGIFNKFKTFLKRIGCLSMN